MVRFTAMSLVFRRSMRPYWTIVVNMLNRILGHLGASKPKYIMTSCPRLTLSRRLEETEHHYHKSTLDNQI